MLGTLYVVATPIGNLEDITARALRVLRQVAIVAAEDTRRTGLLLQHFGIPTPTISLHDHNERQRTPQILARLQAGESVALVSDAGTPLVSDPGYHLVREAIGAGIRVEAVPGPSAVMAALSVSGLPTDEFVFLGFPPAKSAARRRWLEGLARENRTLVFFETPHRIRATLGDALAILGDRQVVVARELTKVHESVVRGPLSAVVAGELQERGEFVVLLSARTCAAREVTQPTPDRDSIAHEFGLLAQTAGSRRDAVNAVAEKLGVSKQAVYLAISSDLND